MARPFRTWRCRRTLRPRGGPQSHERCCAISDLHVRSMYGRRTPTVDVGRYRERTAWLQSLKSLTTRAVSTTSTKANSQRDVDQHDHLVQPSRAPELRPPDPRLPQLPSRQPLIVKSH